jgi:hypothetical protein
MIGGPPASDEYAAEIGANYYGKDAYAGGEIAREMALFPCGKPLSKKSGRKTASKWR